MKMYTLMKSEGPGAVVSEIMRLPLKKLFWKIIRYRNLKKAGLIFALLLFIQLRYSRRFRNYAIRVSMILMFSITFFGFFGTLLIFGIKLQLHKKHASKLSRLQSTETDEANQMQISEE